MAERRPEQRQAGRMNRGSEHSLQSFATFFLNFSGLGVGVLVATHWISGTESETEFLTKLALSALLGLALALPCFVLPAFVFKSTGVFGVGSWMHLPGIAVLVIYLTIVPFPASFFGVLLALLTAVALASGLTLLIVKLSSDQV